MPHRGPWWLPLALWRRKEARRSLLLWVAPVGIGCAAALLAFAANAAFGLFTSFAEHRWWPFVALPLGGAALTWFMRRVGPGAEGSGIQQVIAALRVADEPGRMGRLVAVRLALAKFAAIVGGLGSGFVLGLEGPTVQIGASLFYSFRRFLAVDGVVQRRQLLLAGGAAGIAAAFNAPMAGLIFAFEELSFSAKGHTSGKLVLAVILAGVVAEPVFGYQSYFGRVTLTAAMPLAHIPLLLALAFLGGLVGGGFSWLTIHTARWMPASLLRLQVARPYCFVALCGLCIALAGLAAPIHGSGAELVKEVLAGKASLDWQYMPLKLAGLLLTFLTGLPGGIFSPSLSVGAGLGSWFLPLVSQPWHNVFIAAGMAAVLAGVTRAPLTTAFILIEMTDGHSMVLEALLAALLAAWTARFFRVRFYHDLAERILR